MELGRLEQVNLRDYWKHEALDFTRWLAEDNNLALLSNEIGIEIVLERTEAPVGAFNVDILAYEETTGNKIVIENQLERTDHDHLGKIITYASGYDAEHIIWIVKDVRDEHKQAIDWLNENTTEKVNFFAIKMELWKIGNSAIAPKFHIISKPNNWAKAVKNSSSHNTTVSDLKMLQLEFWNSFADYTEDNNSILRKVKAKPQHWYDISFGTSRAYLSLNINSQKKRLNVGLYIPDDKELYYKLEKQKDDIEAQLGFELDWRALENKKASRIFIRKNINDFNDITQWSDYKEWFKEKAEALQSVFIKYI